MWRNNVLRLRHCSSTTRVRHGVNRRYSSLESFPITAREFDDALNNFWAWKGRSDSRMPIGLAVSGGVDSMALAALYAQAQSANHRLPEAHCFIVDHGVRPESKEEAMNVVEQLRQKFHMKASILSLTWPEDFDPSDSKKFESVARTLRYQALGEACRNAKAFGLMVAHHADDQAETVMMRLASNRVRSGLQAMHTVYYIPESDGAYGIYRSGQRQGPDRNLDIPFPVEQGGMRFFRPLLGFEKSRLIATCKQRGVAWFEDPTNQIPTITSRNAIRSIFKNHRLPEALSKQSLLGIAQHMRKRVEHHRANATRVFEKCLLKLDIQTSSLVVRFPPASSMLSRPIVTEEDKSEAHDTAYCLVLQVAELIAPKTQVHSGQFAAIIDAIYPELFLGEELGFALPGSIDFAKNRTVHGIWWRLCEDRTAFDVPEEGCSEAETQAREWFLTRQTPGRSEIEKPYHSIVYASRNTTEPDASHVSPRDQDTYQFFDGRFWIRLRNLSNDTLTLRIFSKDDLRHIPTVAQEKKFREQGDSAVRPHRFISAAFNLLQSSALRFTLPAVFRTDASTGKETLIGFPTLDVRMHGFGAWEGVCEWSVRYKKIDFGNRHPGDIIVPGLSRVKIIAEEKSQCMQNKGVRVLQLPKRQSKRQVWDRNDKSMAFGRIFGKSERRSKWPGTSSISGRGTDSGELLEGLGFLEEDKKKEVNPKEEDQRW